MRPDFPPSIIFWGTASNAGKSVLAAGLCRLLTRYGYNVAPFKAQNMSLNSWVTEDGGEMGIAQAVQANACGLAPSVNMNPVLLKPMAETGSQVILLGRPEGTMSWSAYVRRKPRIWRVVRQAYADLSRGKDAVILEGAGSPAEINLARHDIANLAMASYAGSSALLVADIDRGGAFAALTGTMSLLPSAQRKRVAGFVLNKFRGDTELLAPALSCLERRWQRPFLGIVPMLPALRLPEEDSASLGIRIAPRTEPAGDLLDIAVVKLPYMSNSPDWLPFVAEPDVRIRLVDTGHDLGRPDLVILPGSRNVGASLDFLKSSGLFDALKAYADLLLAGERGHLVGICAGMQMLGKMFLDPLGIEGGGNYCGLDLLPLVTELAAEKILARRKGEINIGFGRYPCHGYEIHHGRVTLGETFTPVITSGESCLGFGRKINDACPIWGTWLHGVFDEDPFRHDFLDILRSQKGLPRKPGVSYIVGPELDRLADELEKSLDMPAVMSLLAQQNKQT